MDISDLCEEEARKEKIRHDAEEYVRYEHLGYIIACTSPCEIPEKLSKLTKDTPEHNGFLAGLEKYQNEVERNRLLQQVLENNMTWERWKSEMGR